MTIDIDALKQDKRPQSSTLVHALIDRLEAAESDAAHQKALADSALRVAEGWEEKCNTMRADKATLQQMTYSLKDRLEAAEKERDTLRAKIEAMERQEPVAWLHETRRDSDVVTDAVKHVWGKAVVGALAAYSIPLCLAPGAQPASSVPDAWKLVPIEPTPTMITAALESSHVLNAHRAEHCYRAMLAAAPEVKP